MEYAVNQSGNKLYAFQISEGPASTKKSNNNISLNKLIKALLDWSSHYFHLIFMWITTQKTKVTILPWGKGKVI